MVSVNNSGDGNANIIYQSSGSSTYYSSFDCDDNPITSSAYLIRKNGSSWEILNSSNQLIYSNPMDSPKPPNEGWAVETNGTAPAPTLAGDVDAFVPNTLSFPTDEFSGGYDTDGVVQKSTVDFGDVTLKITDDGTGTAFASLTGISSSLNRGFAHGSVIAGNAAVDGLGYVSNAGDGANGQWFVFATDNGTEFKLASLDIQETYDYIANIEILGFLDGSQVVSEEVSISKSSVNTGITLSSSIFENVDEVRIRQKTAGFYDGGVPGIEGAIFNNIVLEAPVVPNAAPTASNVSISGTFALGEQLTGNYTYADDDSDAESGSTFKWYRSDDASGTGKVAIAGATAQTYTLVADDDGKYISFEVTPNDGTEAGTPVESSPVFEIVRVSSIVRQTPSDATTSEDEVTFRVTFTDDVRYVSTDDFVLSGTAAADGTVSSVTAVSSSVYDIKVTGITNSIGTINLDLKGVDGAGSNDIAKIPSQLDANSTADLQITDSPVFGQSFRPNNSGLLLDVVLKKGSGHSYSGAGTLELISGEGYGGTVLATENIQITSAQTEVTYSFSSPPSVTAGTTYTLRVNIPGAPSNSIGFSAQVGAGYSGGILYQASALSSADLYFKLFVSSGPSEALGSTLPATDETYTISNPPVASNVDITGTLNVGQQLTGTYDFSDPQSDTESGSSFKWYRADDASGTNKAAIAGATGTTYTLTLADGGKFISFEVTPSDGTDTGDAVESAAYEVPAAITVQSIARQTPGTANVNAGTEPVFRVTFSENVRNVSADDFTLSSTAGGAVSSVNAVDASIYDVTVNNLNNVDGTLSLKVKGIDGTAGTNNITGIGYSNGVATIQQTGVNDYLNQSKLGQTFTATTNNFLTAFTLFPEAGQHGFAGTVTLEIHSGDESAGGSTVLKTETVEFTASTDAAGQTIQLSDPPQLTQGETYSIVLTNFSGSGSHAFSSSTSGNYADGHVIFTGYNSGSHSAFDLKIDIFEGTQTDGEALLDLAPGTEESYTVQADNISPTVTISSNASNPQSGAFTATFTFSEDVTGFAIDDITISNGAASNFQTTSASVYTATITPAADGEVTINVAADKASDAVGNNNTAATQLSLTNDETAPTVTISSDATNPQSGAFTATFTFSEDVTGFEVGDITVGNGAASNFQTSSASVYTATITPAADGAVTIDVAANKAIDAASNNNIAATQLSITNDETAPSRVSGSIVGKTYGLNQNMDITVEFDEAVVVETSGGTPSINIAMGGQNKTAIYLSGSGTTTLTFRYTTLAGDSDSNGVTVGNIELNGGVIADAAGNNASLNGSYTGQADVRVDTAVPTVTISSSSTGPVLGQFDVTITFSESVTGFEASDLQLSNGTIASGSFSGSGTTYTATINGNNHGNVTVDIVADVATDAAGNGNTSATQFSIFNDIISPSLTITTSANDPINAAFTATFAFDEAVTGFTVDDISVGNGSASNFSGSGTTYTATITPDGDGEVTVDVAHSIAADAAGNFNNSATQLSLTYDATLPTLVSATKDSDTQITLTFSEVVEVAGAANSNFTVAAEDNKSYSVTSISDGTAGDDQLILTFNDLSTAILELVITYEATTGNIGDLASNHLADDATGVTITLNQLAVASNVVFSGELQVGEMLSGTYNYTDPDNDAESGTTFKWYRSEDAAGTGKTAIAGATAQTYTTTIDDTNKFLSFEVTPNDGKYAGVAVESSLQGPINNAPNATNVAISGAMEIGQVITGTYDFNDDENDGEAGSTFKWYRADDAGGTGKVAIAGATSNQYSLTVADANKYISFEVTPSDAYHAGSAVESALQLASYGTPVITAFNQARGIEGGTMTLTGTGFTGVTGVTFGGVAATSFNVVSDTELTAVVGAGNSGSIAVSNPDHSGSTDGFVFINTDTNIEDSEICQDCLPVTCDALEGGENCEIDYQFVSGGATATAGFDFQPRIFLTNMIIDPAYDYSMKIQIESLTIFPGSKGISLGLVRVKDNGEIFGDLAHDIGQQANEYGYISTTGEKFSDGTLSAFGSGYAVGDVLLLEYKAADQSLNYSLQKSGSGSFDKQGGGAAFTGVESGSGDALAVALSLTCFGDCNLTIIEAEDSKSAGSAEITVAGETTDFGTVDPESGDVTKTFAIKNEGTKVLNLTNDPQVTISGTDAADFTVDLQPASSIDAADYTYFDVTFDPITEGSKSATVTIANNDLDENPFTFEITGSSVIPNVAPIVTNVEITGDLIVGQTLTGTYTFSDGDNDPESGSTYQWYMADDANGNNKAAINGATSNTYALTSDHVGKYISFEVTPSDGQLFGTAQESSLQGPVSKIAQSITFNALEAKTYGDEDFELTGTASSNLTVTYTSSNTNVATVSGSTVSIVGAGETTITASQAGNDSYSAATDVTQVLTVNKATLTATADDKSKTYGEENPTLSISYTGFVNGDDETAITQPTASTTADATSEVGTYDITLSGGSADNYSLIGNNGSLTVNKAILTATAEDKSKTYGEANPALSISYAGFVNGDDETAITQPTASTTADAGSDAGTYAITLNGGAADNYTLVTVNGTLTIEKATLTATADDKSKTYGEANPAFTITYAGFVNGDDETAVATEPTASTTADETSNVGVYDIVLSGGSANNYSLSTVNGTLTIEKAILTATAEDKSKTYGEENPALSISYAGFVNGDDETAITQPTASTTADAGSDAGTYAITLSGGAADNYSLTTVNGTLAIGKATLTATADDKERAVGQENPEFTISYTGFVNGDDKSEIDTEPTASTTADETTAAGTAAIVLSGGSDNNYSFNLVEGTLTIVQASFVTSVTVPDDGTYAIGDEITFTVNFALPVTITGNPSLPITVGTETKAATLNRTVNESNTATFTYTIAEGDLDADGIALGASIDLNEGTIEDGFGKDAITKLNNIA
ncbi:beta strand repeat-containing protein, partial [Roseivirga thermotolerans]|uniref:beta strand repeat-containing protein n=2 Tax=Roseivirga thermotolerans TaxID=1758176 RepID=UPI00273E4F5E